MSANFQKWRLLPLVAFLALSTSGNAEEANSSYRDHFTTLTGKTYHQVRLVKVDPNGLLFRHRDGLAKVTFDNLDRDFQEYYGYDKALAQDFEKSHSGKNRKTVKPAAIPPEGAGPENQEIVLTFRTRTLIPLVSENPYSNLQSGCGGTQWFSHWGRYHPGLAYARLPCRQLAARDLLISAGVVPAPRGVSVRRWYR